VCVCVCGECVQYINSISLSIIDHQQQEGTKREYVLQDDDSTSSICTDPNCSCACSCDECVNGNQLNHNGLDVSFDSNCSSCARLVFVFSF
jgi:hypothetical protein